MAIRLCAYKTDIIGKRLFEIKKVLRFFQLMKIGRMKIPYNTNYPMQPGYSKVNTTLHGYCTKQDYIYLWKIIVQTEVLMQFI